MLWCLVTADQKEIDSGDLDEFLASVEDAAIKVIVVLREVSDEDAARYGATPHVSQVVRVKKCGISEARNSALHVLEQGEVADGDYVSFPDDDCKYGSKFLGQFKDIVSRFDAPDLIMGSSGVGPARDVTPRKATAYDALLRVSSVGIFTKWSLLTRVGRFNTALGVGSSGFPYGEDNDMAFRLLITSATPIYAPSLKVWHLEQRAVVGRNTKGYLSVCALHVPRITPVVLLLRGIASAAARDVLAADRSMTQLKATGRALHFRFLLRAIRGRQG